jgi:hypothetical protein
MLRRPIPREHRSSPPLSLDPRRQQLPSMASQAASRESTTSETPPVYTFFLVQVFGLVFLQKLGLPIGDKVMALSLPLMLGSMGMMLLRMGRLELDPKRMVFYSFFCFSALLSQILCRYEFSMGALILLLALYLPSTLRFQVDRATYDRCLRAWQSAMLVVSGIVVVQQVMQRLWGYQSWPNLNTLLPKAILVPNFNYFRETGYGSGVFQPHAIFFLEPSFVSQFLALALVIEFVFFKRRLWMLAFGAGLLLTFAGTGLLIVAAALPLVISRLPARVLAGGGVLVVAGGLLAAKFGLLDQYATRAMEFNQQGSSGYYRFTVPFQMLYTSIMNPDLLFSGSGAGSSVEFEGMTVLPMAVNKLIDEYGLLTTVSFYLLFCYGLFQSTPSATLSVALFVFFNFCGGGLAFPVYVITYIVLGTLLRIEPSDRPLTTADSEARLRPRTNGVTVHVRR